MELFIPSLVVIILGGLVFFFILPKLAPYTLGVMAILLFGVAVFQHYQTFPYEYKGSSVRDMMKDYSPFLMLLATILGLVIGIMVAFGGNPPSIAESMPDMAGLATMPVSLPSIGGNVFGGGNSTAKNNSKSLLGNMGMGGNVKRNNVASTSFKVT
jgi:hypothetical protein